MARTPAKKTAAPGEQNAYVALTYIEHDREPYEVGDDIMLTDVEAAPLLEAKAIKSAGTKAIAAAE